MALPTKGRVIIDTTVGELDIELWSKVSTLDFKLQQVVHGFSLISGSTENMSELPSIGNGR